MRYVFQLIGWLIGFAIVVLSLSPPRYRPVTAVPHNFEHAAIYLAMGIAFAIGYCDRLKTITIGILLFCGAIEIAQFGISGRHARLDDFLVDAAASCVGILAIFVRNRYMARR